MYAPARRHVAGLGVLLAGFLVTPTGIPSRAVARCPGLS
jgi:hypothetical protein